MMSVKSNNPVLDCNCVGHVIRILQKQNQSAELAKCIETLKRVLHTMHNDLIAAKQRQFDN